MSGGTLDTLKSLSHFTYGAFTLFGVTFQRSSVMISRLKECPQPQVQAPGLGCLHSARRYFGDRCFFLFLRVLRCFSSPGSLPYVMDWRTDDRGSLCRVSPFRHLRITGYLLLPEAFRSLSRLSSALSAKASALRPFCLTFLSAVLAYTAAAF